MLECLGTHQFVQIQLWENSNCLSPLISFSLVSNPLGRKQSIKNMVFVVSTTIFAFVRLDFHLIRNITFDENEEDTVTLYMPDLYS